MVKTYQIIPEDGGSFFLRNVGIILTRQTAGCQTQKAIT